jgi:hypothetical protein
MLFGSRIACTNLLKNQVLDLKYKINIPNEVLYTDELHPWQDCS